MKKIAKIGILAFITVSFGSVALMFLIYNDLKLAGITGFVTLVSAYKTFALFRNG